MALAYNSQTGMFEEKSILKISKSHTVNIRESLIGYYGLMIFMSWNDFFHVLKKYQMLHASNLHHLSKIA